MEKRQYTQEEKKVLKSMFIRSHLTFLSFNMTKMEANGFTTTMQPAIESIYGNDEEAKKEAYARHQNFFLCHFYRCIFHFINLPLFIPYLPVYFPKNRKYYAYEKISA